MPKSKLEIRLTKQLAAQGTKDAASMARSILIKRGDLSSTGELTTHGKARQALGAEGRAKDRAARASGNSPSDYVYSKKTNRATLK